MVAYVRPFAIFFIIRFHNYKEKWVSVIDIVPCLMEISDLYSHICDPTLLEFGMAVNMHFINTFNKIVSTINNTGLPEYAMTKMFLKTNC